jgi:hypothetical protein
MGRKLHQIAAIVLGVFTVIHLLNHFYGLTGSQNHIAFMESARLVYRSVLIEWIIVLASILLIVSGVSFLIKWRSRQKSKIMHLQAISGIYLGVFLIIHIGAVISTRVTTTLDTNIYFAAAGLHNASAIWFFAPYYFLAVLAIFVHVGSVLYRKTQSSKILTIVIIIGIVGSLLILKMLFSVEVPAEYMATFK